VGGLAHGCEAAAAQRAFELGTYPPVRSIDIVNVRGANGRAFRQRLDMSTTK